MTYTVQPSSAFKKDLKLLQKRKVKLEKLKAVIKLLKEGQPLPEKYHDHQLSGNLKEYRECHIKPDWLLIYQINKSQIILVLSRTGTHADLFKK